MYLNHKTLALQSKAFPKTGLRKLAATLGSAAALALFAGSVSASTTPTSWDVASEFTDQTNGIAGVWTYGEESSLNVGFTNLPNQTNPFPGNVAGWTNASGFPIVEHNVNQTAFTATGPGGSVVIAPHGLVMHPGPGPNCAYAVARFTAPYAGNYKISGQFFGLDDNPTKTTTDVEVSVNGNMQWTGIVDLNTAAHSASFTTINAALATGGTVDFQVGCGPNGDYNYDSTGLNAVVEVKSKRKHK